MTERGERIRKMLEAGFEQSEICSILDLSPSVVSRTALRLGFRSRPGPPKRYDWDAICAYYEAGHTARQCRERFGFSVGAWDQAITRGDISPRPQPDSVKHSHRTRKIVATLIGAGKTQAAIAAELGISKGTVAFHVRNLGIAPDERFARRFDWDQMQRAYDTGLSAKDCCEQFGCSTASWSQAVRRGAIVPRPRALPLEKLLTNGKKRGRHNLKNRLITAGIKENRCERCGITEWQGNPLSMELHHINGDGHDNRIENLEILCANCHSQTETWGGRNGHRKPRSPRAAN